MKSRYITPVVTIFDEQGRIDPEQNTQVYDFIKNHVSGFVVMGSTGEFFRLIWNARQMIKTCSEFSRGDMKVYAGASRMDVNESISLANYAWEQGLDGVMIISLIISLWMMKLFLISTVRLQAKPRLIFLFITSRREPGTAYHQRFVYDWQINIPILLV